MGNTTNINISFQKDLIKKMDEEIERIGAGANRSGYVNDALKYYLKIRTGLRFLKK